MTHHRALLDVGLREAVKIVHACRFSRMRVVWGLVGYYLLTMAIAAMDGVGSVLLVSLFTTNGAFDATDRVVQSTIVAIRAFGVSPTRESVLLFVVMLIVVRALFGFAASALDGLITPIVRRRLQQVILRKLLGADWEVMRSARVGENVSTMTEQIAVVAKYIYSLIRLGYFLLTLIVLLGVAMLVSSKMTLLLILAGIPVLLTLQVLFGIQSRLSVREADARRAMTGDITERLTNLFQVKVEGQVDRHFEAGMRYQRELTRREIQIGFCQAAIGAIHVLAPALVLMSFYAWSAWRGQPIKGTLAVLGGIGIIGARASFQLNGVIGMWGNLSRFAGNITPVYSLLTLPQERERRLIPERIRSVEVSNVEYSYHNNASVGNVTFLAERGRPVLIQGSSGSGKTTIANLVAGIYRPRSGQVTYVGDSGRRYDAAEFKAKVGYVAQDVYMFHGSIRENLKPSDLPVSDEKFWGYLEEVGASDFVRSMGGLDANIAEAGRSLSGGERRRLAIARCLLTKPDFLIFDEVTNGLDERNRLIVRDAVMRVSEDGIAIIITHEDVFGEIDSLLLLK